MLLSLNLLPNLKGSKENFKDCIASISQVVQKFLLRFLEKKRWEFCKRFFLEISFLAYFQRSLYKFLYQFFKEIFQWYLKECLEELVQNLLQEIFEYFDAPVSSINYYYLIILIREIFSSLLVHLHMRNMVKVIFSDSLRY